MKSRILTLGACEEGFWGRKKAVLVYRFFSNYKLQNHLAEAEADAEADADAVAEAAPAPD